MELIRIVATLLLFGGLGVLVWAVSQGPLAEQASIVAAAGSMFFARQLWRRGVVGVPSVATPAGGASLGQSLVNAVTTQLARRGALTLLIIAIGIGFVFLFVREVIVVAMASIFGDGAAVYLSIAMTAALGFLAQHLADRRFGPPRREGPRVIEWNSLPGEEGIDHVYRIARELTSNSDGFVRRCHWAMLLPVAAGYGVLTLAVREIVTQAMSVFQNLWIAGGVALAIGSLVVMPTLIPTMLKALRDREVTDEASAAPAAPAQVVIPTVANAAPTTSVVTPTTSSPATKKVVRRVVKKKDVNDHE
ncbi:hypothetical protein FOB84_21095 [Gordonia bronchialis]|nr:hypothetical protein [Gordonia bronchialis]MCC3322650.1 hypothetical protein [Gordonia bronchialis]QGS26254.1 hypothetical protein FOB84_21095 [Gordonia bronchialis]